MLRGIYDNLVLGDYIVPSRDIGSRLRVLQPHYDTIWLIGKLLTNTFCLQKARAKLYFGDVVRLPFDDGRTDDGCGNMESYHLQGNQAEAWRPQLLAPIYSFIPF